MNSFANPRARLQSEPKRVLIVGGGFGGAYAARRLGRTLGTRADFEVVLISDQNYLLFTPMLHEVAAGDLHAPDIVAPLRQLLKRVRCIEGEVTAIDLEARCVDCAAGPQRRTQRMRFDHLLLAPGAVTNFFGMDGVAENASTMKTLADAALLRNRMIALLEDAATEPDAATRRRLMTFVVAGGGFAGVETMGAISEFLRDTVRRYPELDPSMLRCVLVHPGDGILPELGARLGGIAYERLRRRGVEFLLGTRVIGYDDWIVRLSRGEPIPANTLVWTAGTRSAPVVEELPVEKVRGRLKVNQYLELAGHEGVVWAVGDSAAVPDGHGGLHPPTAQHGIRQGLAAAHNIEAAVAGTKPKPFAFATIGQMASLGHCTGVAQILGIRFSGFVAWWLWRSVYLAKLPGVARKLRVAIQWTLDWFFPRQVEQLVTRKELEQVQRLARQVGGDLVTTSQFALRTEGGREASKRPKSPADRVTRPAPVGRSNDSGILHDVLQRAGKSPEQYLDIAFVTVEVAEDLLQQTAATHASVWLLAPEVVDSLKIADLGRRLEDAEQRALRAAASAPSSGAAVGDDIKVHAHEADGMHDVVVCIGVGAGAKLALLLHRSESFSDAVGAIVDHAVQPVLTALRKQNWIERLETEWAEAKTHLEAEVHDLQQPLTTLRLGMQSLLERAQDLQDRDLVETAKGLVGETERAVASAKALAHNRRAAGAELQSADPLETVRMLRRQLVEQARTKSIVLHFALPEEQAEVSLDPKWFARVIQNLVDNAIKYSPKGAFIAVSAEFTASEFVLHVDDEGPGFAPSDLKGLFLPGATGSATPTAGEPQTGMGLWIARHAMRAMGGRLWVDRTRRIGARVSLALPMSRLAAESR